MLFKKIQNVFKKYSRRTWALIGGGVVATAAVVGLAVNFTAPAQAAWAPVDEAWVYYSQARPTGETWWLGPTRYNRSWYVDFEVTIDGVMYTFTGTAQCHNIMLYPPPAGWYKIRNGRYQIDNNGNMSFLVDPAETIRGGNQPMKMWADGVPFQKFYQPVAQSDVPHGDNVDYRTLEVAGGYDLRDELTVFEANADASNTGTGPGAFGKQTSVTDSQWRKDSNGNFAVRQFNLYAYGPFGAKQDKYPATMSDNDRYFGSGTASSSVDRWQFDGAKLSVIGDRVSVNAESTIRQAMDDSDQAKNGSGADGIQFLASNSTGFSASPAGISSIRSTSDFVVVQLGSTIVDRLRSDPAVYPGADVYLVDGVYYNAAGILTMVENLRNNIRAQRGNDVKIIFVTAYDGKLKWNVRATTGPCQIPPADPDNPTQAEIDSCTDNPSAWNTNSHIMAFNQLLKGVANSDSNIFVLDWHSIVTTQEELTNERCDGNAPLGDPLYCSVTLFEPSSFVQMGSGVDDGITPTALGRERLAAALIELLTTTFAEPDKSIYTPGNSGNWGVAGTNPAPAGAPLKDGTKTFTNTPNISNPADGPAAGRDAEPTPVIYTGSGQNTASGWPAGYYYFVAHMNRNASANNDSKIVLEDWYSPFGDPREQAILRFQPYVTSSAVADGRSQYIDSTTDAIDTITSHVTNSSGAKLSDHFWNGIDVNVCVDLYGPSQVPLAKDLDEAPSGLNRAGTQCKTFNEAGISQDFNFGELHSGNTDINLNGHEGPGYYYFQAYINDSQYNTGRTDAGGAAIDDKQTESMANLIIGNWKAQFNPTNESEWLYVKWQPYAESLMQGNRKPEDMSNDDRGVNKGVVFDCDEITEIHTHSDGSPIVNGLPPEKVTCKNVTDWVYIGATDARDVSGGVVGKQYSQDFGWPMNAAKNYEQLQYRVQLYGPFADPEGRNPTTGVGKTAQVVPYSPIGSGSPEFTMTQPAASTGWLTANEGPRSTFYSKKYYESIFKQSAQGNGVGELTTKTLSLLPGFYVAVVEMPKSQQTATVQNLVSQDFYSAWGDAYESLSISTPLHTWSLRGNSDEPQYEVGDIITDTIWVSGFSQLIWTANRPGGSLHETPRLDALGNVMHPHGCKNCFNGQDFTGFPGKDGYFEADSKADLTVTLYGPYDDRPTTDQCKVDDPVADEWTFPWTAADNNSGQQFTTAEYKIAETGWYVYYVSYPGDDRSYPFHSRCDDANEMVNAGPVTNPQTPRVKTTIQTAKPTVPTAIFDEVRVSGANPDRDSVITLRLYERLGAARNPGSDRELCTVTFKVSGMGAFNTKNYVDANTGTVINPENGSGDCFAQEAGYFYWTESFARSNGDKYHPDNIDDPDEGIKLEHAKPEVITTADESVYVGNPFKDTAYVTIPDGDTREYELYFTAYGPQIADGSAPVCDVNNNVLFESGPIAVTGSGTYESGTTTALTPGNVYWIETLVDKNDPNYKFSGYCGKQGEITRVNGPAVPAPPVSGMILRSVVAVTMLGAITTFLIWQYTTPKSLLFRRNK